MNGSRPVRALVLLLVGYGCVRTAIVWMPAAPVPRAGPPPSRAAARTPGRRTGGMAQAPVQVQVQVPALAPSPAAPVARALPPARIASAPVRPPHAIDRVVGTGDARIAALPAPAFPAPIAPHGAQLAPLAPPPPAPPPAPASRWSGYAYLFHRRDGGGAATLAPGGQIGGSQAAARIAWRPADAVPLALAARIATPLRDTAQAEVAAGLDVLPLPGLRLALERRIAIGRTGRDAFAAYAAGGLYRAVAARLELDGYAQAGFVGARRRDPFADGALRLHHRTRIADTADLRIGLAGWGAAQPGAARLDIGPRAAVTTRAGRAGRLPLTLAVEGRIRVAGRARPGNGLALTLATDF